MIKPTPGRVVHYRMADWKNIEGRNGIELYSDAPCTAFIVYVWSDTCVNLVGFDHAGNMFRRTSVPINQTAGASAWAEWMPYQLGQAAKTEKAEDNLEEVRRLAGKMVGSL